MINKKIWYIWLCTMSLGQISAMGSDEGERSQVGSIDIPDLDFTVQGKLQSFPGGTTNDVTEVRKFVQRIKSHIAVYIHEIDADYKKFLEQAPKIQNNSVQFKQKYKENITTYLHDKNKVLNLNKEVQVLMQKTFQATKDWDNAVGYFKTDDEAKQKAMTEIQDNVNTLAKYFKEIQAIAQKFADEVGTLPGAAQADAKGIKDITQEAPGLGAYDLSTLEQYATIAINIPGQKDPLMASAQDNDKLFDLRKAVTDYLQNTEKAVTILVAKFDKDFENFKKYKAVMPEFHTTDFQGFYESKLSKLQEDKNSISGSKSAMKRHIDKVNNALSDWADATHVKNYVPDIINSAQTINENLVKIDNHYNKIKILSDDISATLKGFSSMSFADVQQAKLMKDQEKAKQEAQKAADAELKAEQAKESKNKADAEAAATAAAAAQREADTAKRLAEEQEKTARNAQAKAIIEQAEQEALKINYLVDRFISIRDSSQYVMFALEPIIDKIKKDSEKYPQDLVKYVDAKYPIIVDVNEKFNARVKNANNMLDKMKVLNDRVEKLKELIAGWVSSSSATTEANEEISQILPKYKAQYKVLISLFETCEKYEQQLFSIYNELNEKIAVEATKKETITQKPSTQEIDPRKAGRVLELTRAAQGKISNFSVNVLELIRAAKSR